MVAIAGKSNGTAKERRASKRLNLPADSVLAYMIIRDAIHGGIETSELEEAVIDHPLFQRLRRVRQLAMAHLVYPSAQHTRFEHSLGSMHLTGKLAARLELGADAVRTVRLAALLHDVGHGAFSHTSDELLMKKTGESHEMRGMALVEKSNLSGLLEENGASLSELRRCFQGKGAGALITHELGCDRIDYLMRDGHFTGVAYASVDAPRLLETMTLTDGGLTIQEKGAVAAESLLVSRHLMFTAVYLHPTVRIAGAMAEQMLDAALADGHVTLDEIAAGTDDALLSELSGKSTLARRLLERRLYKKAFVLKTQDMAENEKAALEKKDAKTGLKAALADAGVTESVVILPPERKKAEPVWLIGKNGKRDLSETSTIVRALGQPSSRDSLIVACDEKQKEKAARAAEQALA